MSASNGLIASITGVVTLVKPGECYIESADKLAGIRVIGDSSGVQIGDTVTVSGTLTTIGSERVVDQAVIIRLNDGTTVPTPFTMNNKAIGGAVSTAGLSLMDYSPVKVPGDGYKLQWLTAGGCGNVGLLIKTTGKVTAVYADASALGGKWFYVDDGSGVAGDFGDAGVLVYSDAAVKEGDYVSVTGISGVEPALDMTDKLMRVIITRSANDVVVLKDAAAKQLPFSDEFDSSTLDKRWAKFNSWGSISLTDTPGCLTYCAISQISGNDFEPLQLMQPVTGDWDLEFKVKPDYSPDVATISQGCFIVLKSYPSIMLRGSGYISLAGVKKYDNYYPYAVYLLGQNITLSAESDWYYFRLRSRNGVFYGSWGTDGVNYSQEYSCPGDSSGFISVYGRSYYSGITKPTVDFHAHIDYFRLTSAAQ